MLLWRISNYADLSGKGGLVAPGRWHRQGIPVVYCSDHPSTTLLEILVQINLPQMPRHFQLLKIRCPDDIEILDVPVAEDDLVQMAVTQSKGSELLETNAACLIRVPSAIMPEAANILINPRHPRANEIHIEEAKSYPFDSRLFR
jgi:RES domain-containing protein